MGSALRSDPYNRKQSRPKFSEIDGMKCDEGHIPEYDKDQIPFLSYSHRPVRACVHNGLKRFLVWDHKKSKYCCDREPDDNQKIMERSLQNIYNVATKIGHSL
jgi:hypothetical protein